MKTPESIGFESNSKCFKAEQAKTFKIFVSDFPVGLSREVLQGTIETFCPILKIEDFIDFFGSRFFFVNLETEQEMDKLLASSWKFPFPVKFRKFNSTDEKMSVYNQNLVAYLNRLNSCCPNTIVGIRGISSLLSQKDIEVAFSRHIKFKAVHLEKRSYDCFKKGIITKEDVVFTVMNSIYEADCLLNMLRCNQILEIAFQPSEFFIFNYKPLCVPKRMPVVVPVPLMQVRRYSMPVMQNIPKSTQEKREVYGERVYEMVENRAKTTQNSEMQQNAAKITGMLLDLPEEEIENFIEDREIFEELTKEAAAMIRE